MGSHINFVQVWVWPRMVDGPVLAPDRDVLNYIKYQNIKWAKSNKKQECELSDKVPQEMTL